MIEIEEVSFHYGEGSGENGLDSVSLTISSGQVVVLCGESGCGKTTLTRLINGLIPHYYAGMLSGHVLIDGEDISAKPVHENAKKVGSVFQNPKSQFFTVDTTSEVAFGCENMRWERDRIAKRISEISAEFGIEELMDRNLFRLSGGEKQKIACASVAAPEPEIFVLDEPSSNLDQAAIRDLAGYIAKWKSEGKTVVVAEHRLSYLMNAADRFVYLKNGRIEKDIPASDFKALSDAEIEKMGLRPIRRALSCRKKAAHEGHVHLRDVSMIKPTEKSGGMEVLHIDSLSIPKGSITAILGNNGAGKSTFARVLSGLEKKSHEQVEIDGKTYKKKELLQKSFVVMQDVNHQLFAESVYDEVRISLDKSLPVEQEKEKVEGILSTLNLLELSERHPQSLSGGQKQRVAIACANACGKDILIYDEPTSGLDLFHMKEVSDQLLALSERGVTQLVITHDPELVYRTCDYAVFVEKGSVLWSGDIDSHRTELADYFAL